MYPCRILSYTMMTSSNGNRFRVTGLLCGEFTGHRWIPRTKASDAELGCFLWSAPEPTVEQTMETPVIWDATALIMTSLEWPCQLRPSSLAHYPNGHEAGREAAWGSEFVPLKKREVGSFILLHKISWTACCFGIRTFLKQYNCYESAPIWYTDHQYLAQCSEIINNLQEIPLIFCNYTVRSCGTLYKGLGQSPRNVVSISDLELYVTETNTGVCDPVTD